jgi:hypothetical protein
MTINSDDVFGNHSSHQIHKRTRVREKPQECNQCGKHLVLAVTLKYMKGSTLERHFTYGSTVENPSCLDSSSKHEKTHKGHSNVGKPSFL